MSKFNTKEAKVAIIGQGTAGAMAMAFYYKSNMHIDWYYDSSTPTQAVGEGSNLAMPQALRDGIDFQHSDLEKLDGSFKIGVDKRNWGTDCEDFIHQFPPPSIAYHFNAKSFQKFIYDKVKDNEKINIIDKKITNPHDIDADFVMDCSGRPNDLDMFETDLSIAVDSVHVTQCYWDYAQFQKTLTIARPYGWVFGIPLQNRCSIGYLYNHKINTLEEVKEDVKEIFKEFNLTPSTDTNTFTFGNYFKKKNFDGKVVHNGNASFFLEPLEASSISTMDEINNISVDYWSGRITEEHANYLYTKELREIELMMAIHYYSGSKFDTEFWRHAKEKSGKYVEKMITTDERLILLLNMIKTNKVVEMEYGSWSFPSWEFNLRKLGIYDKIIEMTK